MHLTRLNPFLSGAGASIYAGFRLLVLATIALVWSIAPGIGEAQLSMYTYRDTQSLVSLVEEAAALVEKKGENAFKEFAQKDSKWLNDDYYIFAYRWMGPAFFIRLRPN
jgi:hypothetical protein